MTARQGSVASQDALEKVDRQECAFGVDGGEGVAVACLHAMLSVTGLDSIQDLVKSGN